MIISWSHTSFFVYNRWVTFKTSQLYSSFSWEGFHHLSSWCNGNFSFSLCDTSFPWRNHCHLFFCSRRVFFFSQLTVSVVGESSFSQLTGIFFLVRLVLFLSYYYIPRVFLYFSACLSGHQLHHMVSFFLLTTKSSLNFFMSEVDGLARRAYVECIA